MAATLSSAALAPYLTSSSSKHFFLPELTLLVHYLLFTVCLPSWSVSSVAVGVLTALFSAVSHRTQERVWVFVGPHEDLLNE